jgi:hypothetical protein
MKTRFITMSIFGLSIALIARGDDLPTRLNFDRYQGMLEHSPFAVATAVVAPAATPNFAKDLYISSAAKSPDGDMVVIQSMTDKDFKKHPTTKEPDDGYAISSIEWSDKVGETKVTISKDGQYATLTFNQAEMAKPAPGQVRAPGVVPPAMPNTPNFQQRQVGVPTPSPRVRGVIQRNPPGQTPKPSDEE